MWRIIRISLLYITAVVVVPTLSEFPIRFAEQEGLYRNPKGDVMEAIAFVHGLLHPWGIYASLFLSGLTLGVWLDAIFRRAGSRNKESHSPSKTNKRNTKVDAISLDIALDEKNLQYAIESGAPIARCYIKIGNIGDGFLSDFSAAISSIRPNVGMPFPQRLDNVKAVISQNREDWVELFDVQPLNKGKGRIRLNLPNYGTADYDPFIPLQDCWIAVVATAREARKAEMILKITVHDGPIVSVEKMS